MRRALRWLLLLAGLLGSPPCGGVATDPSSIPPANLTDAIVSPPNVTSHPVTSLDLTSAMGGPTTKSAALPTSPTSPVAVVPSKAPTTGATVKTTTPSFPTKPGDTTSPVAVIAANTTASRAPTLIPALPTTHPTSSRGIAKKDFVSTSGLTAVTLSNPPPSSTRPVGSGSTAKSPGPSLIPAKTSAVPRIVSGPILPSVTTAKTGTSKDKFWLSLTSPKTLMTTTMPKPAGSPRNSTVHSSSSGFSAHPTLKTTPLSPGTTAPQEESHIPSPSSQTNLSSVQGQTKIVCVNKMPPKEKAIILSLNESRPCGMESIDLCASSPASFSLSGTYSVAVKAFLKASAADNKKSGSIQSFVISSKSLQERLASCRRNGLARQVSGCAMPGYTCPKNSLEGSPLKEVLMEVLCKTLKPNYNQKRDDCTILLASDTEDLKRVAVIKTSVQTHFVDEELSEALAAKKAELEKFGVNNITYGGQTLDAEPKDHLSLPLIITIICMAASLLLVAAIYGCCHQRISQRKDQRLTEELHTIENGYHDNPTLEVMETLSEMQEKKVNLNGEVGDSWIVPMDSLTKDELDEEEDTHL